VQAGWERGFWQSVLNFVQANSNAGTAVQMQSPPIATQAHASTIATQAHTLTVNTERTLLAPSVESAWEIERAMRGSNAYQSFKQSLSRSAAGSDVQQLDIRVQCSLCDRQGSGSPDETSSAPPGRQQRRQRRRVM